MEQHGALARVNVTLKLRASIAELRVPRRITAQAYQDELNAALAALVTGWAEDVIAASQALGADFLGVGQRSPSAAGADGPPSATTGRPSGRPCRCA